MLHSQIPKPVDKRVAPNPWNTQDFQDIVMRLISNNGRYENNQYADILYDSKLVSVFKTNRYKEDSFDWKKSRLFSVDHLSIDDVIYGLESEQMIVVLRLHYYEHSQQMFFKDSLIFIRNIEQDEKFEIIELLYHPQNKKSGNCLLKVSLSRYGQKPQIRLVFKKCFITQEVTYMCNSRSYLTIYFLFFFFLVYLFLLVIFFIPPKMITSP